MKLWIGDEKEGIYTGNKTLFVGSDDITFEEIKSVIQQYDDIQQIYFGAGRCTKINSKVVEKCYKNLYPIITLEIDINDLHKYRKDTLDECELIITINNKNFLILDELDGSTQIKIQSVETKKKILGLTMLENFDEVNTKELEGKTYKGDKVIK